jgi:hypothetical protein
MSSVPSTQTASNPTKLQLVSRVSASLLGSYGFVWGFATLTTVLGAAAGMPFGEAYTLAALLAFVVFLICFCWAFTERSLARVWLVLATGAVVMSALGWLGSSAMT